MAQFSDKDLRSFDTIRHRAEKLHDLNHPDQIVDLRTCRFMRSGRIYVPGRGWLETNQHSLKQLAQRLGIKWETWFMTEKHAITDEEVQEEIQRRLSRDTSTHMLIRSRRHEKAKADSDGIIRAFLSPSYEAIDDVRVLERMQAALGDRTKEIRFWKKRTGETDWGSHYTAVLGEAQTFGTGGDGPVMATPGRDGDVMYAGFKMRNSEVGCHALTLDEFWLRLVCLNGLMAQVDNQRMLYRTHRAISNNDLDSKLVVSFRNLPERHARQKERFEQLLKIVYADHGEAKRVLTRFMTQRRMPQRLIDTAVGNYDFSTHDTGEGDDGQANGYWVLNALTRTARDMEPEERHELELSAGDFLMHAKAA